MLPVQDLSDVIRILVVPLSKALRDGDGWVNDTCYLALQGVGRVEKCRNPASRNYLV